MKKTLLISILLVTTGGLLLYSGGCKQKEYTNPPPYQIPEMTTDFVVSITETTAICQGSIGSDGGTTVTERGVCWSTSSNPTTSDAHVMSGGGTGTFSGYIVGLTANTPYYVRGYATNSAGTGYGNQLTFTTMGTGGTVTDIDGNIYHTVTIGLEVWMVENLKVTHYRNGDPIPNITDGPAWSNLSTGAYCDYNNTPGNASTYGKIYNFSAVNDTRKLCPAGWHIPTDGEWTWLTTYLGGESVAGGKLKETGTIHWQTPNTGATNESGFTALPGGFRDINGTFSSIGTEGNWWSATEYGTSGKVWYRKMNYNVGTVITVNSNKKNGYSVRCLRD